MASPQELSTAKYLPTPQSEPAPAEQAAAVQRSPGGSTQLVIRIAAVAIITTVVGTAAICLLNRDPAAQPQAKKSNTAADLFLWVMGTDKTWEEYQDMHRARGRERLDEEKFDWTQQALNDAYIGDWDPEEEQWRQGSDL